MIALSLTSFAQMSGGKIKRTHISPSFNKEFLMSANVAYANFPQYSYGISLGHVKRVGWYLSLMSNFNFKGFTTDYQCQNDGFVNGTLPFYSGKKSTTRISAMGGVAFRVFPWWQFHAGVGYGYRGLFWETTDQKWVKNQTDSYQGIDAEIGTGFIIKGFYLSAGMVTTNFKTLEAKVGIGFSVGNKKK